MGDDRAQRPGASGGALARAAAWLFERRPPRETAAGTAPAEPRAAFPDASEGGVPRAEPAAVTADRSAGAAPAVGVEPEPEAGVKIRPRPYAGAPVKLVPEHPGDTFFTRTEAEDDRLAREEERAERAVRKADKRAARHARPPRREKKSDETRREKSDQPRQSPPERTRLPRGVRALVRTSVVVVVAIVAALLLRAYVVQQFYIPSPSMEPTLHGCSGCNNDHVLVEKLSYRFHDVQPGDVVVFHRPDTWHVSDPVLIKRVIAVSGDRLELRGGHVYRNGARLDEPYVNQSCRHGTTDKAGSTAVTRYATIPNGDVFVMGDNRCDSEDSRWFGVVPVDKIIGRAFLIVWPFHRIHSL